MITEQDVSRFWSKVNKTDGCWLWTANRSYDSAIADYKRYGGIRLIESREFHGLFWLTTRTTIGAHRFAYMLYYGEDSLKDGLQVMHLCNNGLCVRKEHLRLGTPQENYLMALEDGLAVPPKGEEHWNHKLTEQDVRDIRMLLTEGYPARDIGELIGCSRQSVNDIAARRTWAWLV